MNQVTATGLKIVVSEAECASGPEHTTHHVYHNPSEQDFWVSENGKVSKTNPQFADVVLQALEEAHSLGNVRCGDDDRCCR